MNWKIKKNKMDNDLIGRQAAIDASCKDWCGCTYANCPNQFDLEDLELEKFCDGCDTVVILKKLPPAQPEQRWIPCSERLPEEKDAGILKKLGIEKRSEDVLATVEVKGERMTVTACTYNGKWEWDMKYAFPDYKVIAWMPLPEPYREEGEKHEGSD